MPTVASNGLELYYEQLGEPSDPALLLIHGLGAQLTGWNPRFLERLAAAGFFVTFFDNRDVGKSTWFDHVGDVDGAKVLMGEIPPPYTVADMAADAAGLVHALSLGPVHVMGVSMGGMIAQQYAIDHPALTRSLTSIMSTPAPMEVGSPTPEALEMLTRTRSEDLETFLDEEVVSWRLTAGRGYPLDEQWVRDSAVQSWERGRNPLGVARQLMAVTASPDRRPGLATVTAPSLVIHGLDDNLVTPSGGDATAAALATSSYVRYAGMGHSLPEELWDAVIAEIAAVAARAR